MELEGSAFGADRRRRMTAQRPRRTRSTGRAMSLEQLDAWLYTLQPAPRVNGTSMLDGYLTAIVIGPCSIPPDEWFVHLLGEHGRIATATGATLAAIRAIVVRFNAISEGLSLAPSKHAPLFEKTRNGLGLPQPWCMGFLSAMQLRFDHWRPLLDVNRIDYGLLLPILLYCTDSLGRPMLGPPREGPETEQFLRTAYQDIPRVVPAIRDFWMPQRLKKADRQP
ncbi:MAG TPA: UPF0149 family protein [Crenalkalicoccus sp.]|nr:UPF0149 family protein [Crenalkalicoccus sp.]